MRSDFQFFTFASVIATHAFNNDPNKPYQHIIEDFQRASSDPRYVPRLTSDSEPGSRNAQNHSVCKYLIIDNL